MRRGVLVIVALLLLSSVIVLIPKDVEAVGTPSFTMHTMMDYQGYKADDPVDVSTGFVGYDPDESPTIEVIVEIDGTVEVTTTFPQIQEIVVILDHIIETDYGPIVVDYHVEPEQLVFSNLLPGETQKINYTMYLTINGSVPAGANEVVIGGRWSHALFPTGGRLQSTGGGPLHISPVVSAGFDGRAIFDEVELLPSDETYAWATIINNGNVKEPILDIEIDGVSDASQDGISVEYTLEPTGDYHFNLDFHIVTSDSPENSDWDFEVLLIDPVNDTMLDSFEFILYTLEEGVEPPIGDDDDDDDDPPIGDDDDEEPIVLLTEAQCLRTYTDAQGDDLEYYATDDEDAGVEKGVKPEADINTVTVRRNGEDLVITITTYGLIQEYTSFTVYILPDDDHVQPPLNLNPQISEDFPDYEPDDYVDTNALSFFWGPEEVIVGRTCTITWSLESLMEDGLTEDFEVFVQVTTFDALISGPITDPDFVIVYVNVDYAGSGAWEVGQVKGDLIDPVLKYSLSRLIIPAVVVGVIILLIILGVIFFVISRKRKSVFD